MSREIRPVFVEEMNLLGFDRFWRYDPDYRGVYLLAERNGYWYGGTKIAVVRGGRIGVDPVLHPMWLPGARISPMDELPPPKRGHILADLEAKALHRADEVFRTTPHDLAYIGFSGGKDSLVMAHLLGREFPDLPVSFGDTGMEFPQTYEIARWMAAWCAERGIQFRVTRPAIDVDRAWGELFGPPSRAIRWCCSVCKSAPQQNDVRGALGRSDAVTMSVVGVRAAESPRRAKYSDLEYSKKVNGQWAFHPILSWSSLDVWRYVLEHGLPIHDGYRHGFNRVGCAVCPMARSSRSEWIAWKIAPDTVGRLLRLTSGALKENLKRGRTHEDFVLAGDWKVRVTPQMLSRPAVSYSEREEDDDLVVNIVNPSSDWREWIKTVHVPFDWHANIVEGGGMEVRIPLSAKKEHRVSWYRLRGVFRKAATCVGCGVCEANCPHGALRFVDGVVRVGGCRRCGACHAVETSCLRFKSAGAFRVKERAE